MAITINSDGITLDLKWTDGQISTGGNVTINERDTKTLLNDIQSIESWAIGALAGKINNCRKRLLDEHRSTYMSDASVNTDDEVLDAVFAASGYKDAATRAAE